MSALVGGLKTSERKASKNNIEPNFEPSQKLDVTLPANILNWDFKFQFFSPLKDNMKHDF